jgi:hypothetical protein
VIAVTTLFDWPLFSQALQLQAKRMKLPITGGISVFIHAFPHRHKATAFEFAGKLLTGFVASWLPQRMEAHTWAK